MALNKSTKNKNEVIRQFDNVIFDRYFDDYTSSHENHQ